MREGSEVSAATIDPNEGSVADHGARVVVTGLDARGRSTVASDSVATQRFVSPVATLNTLWETETLPITALSDSAAEGDRYFPAPGAVKAFTVAFPPDSTWAEDRTAHGGGDGFHSTASLDVFTLIEGTLICVLDDGEVVLEPGDTIVQRGTRHTWRNRSDGRAILSGFVIATADATSN
ncbi:hypothetical protein GCM10009775_07930 [Microbacterium aoyamense]|uniref:Cupin type-2 domain-containing protein n=1 Tax=Microbacterium aoyamense TaxID=344166 RepID=A0ABN2PDI6_9MICO|nr:cupin domain-containing protein [Microbacterium aoyamense]